VSPDWPLLFDGYTYHSYLSGISEKYVGYCVPGPTLLDRVYDHVFLHLDVDMSDGVQSLLNYSLLARYLTNCMWKFYLIYN